uniref:Uncharacterized protein n=1 Tax=Lygus hesperus TaxID=30085 RepID=A0A0A9YRY8_LYGHE
MELDFDGYEDEDGLEFELDEDEDEDMDVGVKVDEDEDGYEDVDEDGYEDEDMNEDEDGYEDEDINEDEDEDDEDELQKYVSFEEEPHGKATIQQKSYKNQNMCRDKENLAEIQDNNSARARKPQSPMEHTQRPLMDKSVKISPVRRSSMGS